MDNILKINPEKEVDKITDFIREALKKTGLKKVVIGVSGGIDSATSLFLLKKAVNPNDIIAVNLPYFDNHENILDVETINIKKMVDSFTDKLEINDKVRFGNIMARVRMIILYDLAKKNNALVAGTENKSEYLLGYFTRFGDEASDFEPIQHLYKTQVYKIAEYLGISPQIIQKIPSADLWVGQTDENELGFTYEEVDPVLYLYFEKKLTIEEIEKKGYKKALNIIKISLKNKFKHEAPYRL